MSILESSRRAKTRHLLVAALGLLVMLAATLALTPNDAQAQPGVLEYHTHACIESDTVQGQSAASGLSVGNTFITDNYESFIIVMGGPTCTLDTSTCDASLNMYLVNDVKTCLAAAAAPAADAAADAAPAAHSGGSAGTGSLAHTGVEHELAGAFATALVGAGCAALGLARANRRRRD